MLGRGMVRDPGLALAIAAAPDRNSANSSALRDDSPGDNPAHIPWAQLLPLVADFWHLVRTRLDRKKQCGRLKQWLNFLRQRYPEATLAYLELRTTNDPLVIERWLQQQELTAPA
jgi:tRNA-dihydrouridine synthase C